MTIVIFMLIAYLLGSVPSGLWIGKYFYGKDLRDHGSGNTGTTNTFRILGVKAGCITFAADCLKGTIATVLPMMFGVTQFSPILIGAFAILGHTFPVFAGFKGGKAVATSAGVLLGFAPLYLLFLLAVFLIALYLSSMISLASIISALVGIITTLIFPAFHFLLPDYDWLFTVIIIAVASLIIIRHRDNISRIRHREENLVPWGLNLTKQQKNKNQ
ncbi:glycerol-3-phosphate 1-O-acyltransferase PlsY [Streptococcus chenjunshii]|uniref:Glycerol-3-phosphate acyltransferase n=1 Tax=Streptococcus chenjunshii TaxID=2173853 RepID=A0A372KR44_9STRE|nr:glycerol-3-phosphate 1-O-acyltransferase PlsY [Streptococcus chenjunshii]AXQ78600.1 glycerol-3-phosphate 1-O-acyltransferase PlsY [Streptococcus chenjunshii]RFU51936.1 glycerol-3-phosphate 1-O-acyltransferase PlsY [Streptococcus chenjunshii]RFU54128.1 glycerol-3-phosphate 1-O-acyltransferase PlsY [Streptococcus chenjunshii]